MSRVKWCIERQKEIDQHVDDGIWLSAKEKNTNNNDMCMDPQLPNFPSIWKAFPSQQIPKNFNEGHVYEYFMSLCVFEDDNKENDDNGNSIDYSTSKSLKRAQQYFDSGHVTDMQDS